MPNPGKEKLTDDEATARLAGLHYTPQVPYPGLTSLPWRATCDDCGRPANVVLSANRPCRYCSRGMPTPAQAHTELQRAGFTPLEPFPNGLYKSWSVACSACELKTTVTLASIRGGRTCQSCARNLATPEQAEAELREAGYKPAMPYPGSLRRPWTVRCRLHGHKRRIYLKQLRQGHSVECRECEKIREAGRAKITMKRARYVPETDYPGSPQAAWPSHCADCGKPARPTLYQVRNGRRCACVITARREARAARDRARRRAKKAQADQ